MTATSGTTKRNACTLRHVPAASRAGTKPPAGLVLAQQIYAATARRAKARDFLTLLAKA